MFFTQSLPEAVQNRVQNRDFSENFANVIQIIGAAPAVIENAVPVAPSESQLLRNGLENPPGFWTEISELRGHVTL